ncbi:hypothetical protein RFI_08718 [Reticulomyxa filosa]|uniref:EF-hand domain-containing protein n=1 Tax=Reticulomyxa filosa TaxID=46433 RepID=X6NRU2_RETFI|nr:hypothetical protein RFI_08718 [Reticulomyxa filosa]|eukprot:ETO28419.1 hypothetical protein RFI_08718 [Reticulomyxa filosa]
MTNLFNQNKNNKTKKTAIGLCNLIFLCLLLPEDICLLKINKKSLYLLLWSFCRLFIFMKCASCTLKKGNFERNKLLQMSQKQTSSQMDKDSIHVREFKMAFELFDEKKTGKLTAKELRRILNGLGQSATEVEIDELIKEADKNRDNAIDLDEFIELMVSKMHSNKFDDELAKAWKTFDKTGRGKIGINELREVMLSLGEDLSDAQLKLMIDEIDTDKDNYITFEGSFFK